MIVPLFTQSSDTIPDVKQYSFDPYLHQDLLLSLLKELLSVEKLTPKLFSKIVKLYARENGDVFSKDQIVMAYREFSAKGLLPPYDPHFINTIKMKPIRTGSGVTPVTVLTKPFPCPGKCIFCPNDIRMPKSYLRDEPGAQRAERNQFDPYLQTMSRLKAYQNIGHLTDKVEIIILGGTWSFYPESYQIWFIKRVFEAMNDFGKGLDKRAEVEELYKAKRKVSASPETIDTEIKGESLQKTYNQVISELYTAPEKLLKLDSDQHAGWDELFIQHRENETSDCRCVGLVIETRPDNISEEEVIRIRKLGCTKTQIGFQSLQDEVLEKNKRGHDVEATRKAVKLLRLAGFKIHAHWMPNLYGSSVQKDIEDYHTLYHDEDFKPDELKIYPCSLIDSAELMQYYKKGLWKPYSHEELLKVLSYCFAHTPQYSRLTRVIRDIPSTDIVVGNKKTNFREIAEKYLLEKNIRSIDIRSREIRHRKIDPSTLQLTEVPYSTSVSNEIFLQFVTPENEAHPEESCLIAGFLRLSLPKEKNFIPELTDSAMIREIHVYGQTTSIGKSGADKTQHLGLGKKLTARAIEIAKEKGYAKLQVISAIGTREYYRKLGFQDGELYQYYDLSSRNPSETRVSGIS